MNDASPIGEQTPVSVVIATHNRPELVRVAIRSVIAQDYPGPIEIVVVYDGTETDPTLSELVDDSTSNRSIRITKNGRTQGLAGARNTGILESTGELVAFCDDDDRWQPAKVGAQVATFDDPAVLTSVTGITVHYGDTETVRVPDSTTITLDELVRRRVMEAHPSSVMVRRAALLGEIGLVDELIPGSYGEDFDWILRAAKAGRIAAVGEALVDVQWGQSLFSRNWQMIVDAIEYIVDKHPELQADSAGLARLMGRRAFALAALGRRREALSGVRHTLGLKPTERRAYLAAAVALRLVDAERLLAFAHKRGRGI